MILDTVALIRLLRDELPEDALRDLERAETLVVSAASVFEVNQKVRVGKLPMRPLGPAEIAALGKQEPLVSRCGALKRTLRLLYLD